VRLRGTCSYRPPIHLKICRYIVSGSEAGLPARSLEPLDGQGPSSAAQVLSLATSHWTSCDPWGVRHMFLQGEMEMPAAQHGGSLRDNPHCVILNPHYRRSSHSTMHRFITASIMKRLSLMCGRQRSAKCRLMRCQGTSRMCMRNMKSTSIPFK